MIAERSFSAGSYRFGFNGKEKDDEVKGNGNSLDFGARIYDSRLGRWLSRDPKTTGYESPYAAFANSPIIVIDPDGRENIIVISNAGDHPQPATLLKTGLNEALRLQAHASTGDERTTLIIFEGNYTKGQISSIQKVAQSAGIVTMVLKTADQISSYVNTKTGENSRDGDLVTDFSYVGHANSNELLVGQGYLAPGSTTKEVLKGSDFSSSAFAENSKANLVGCRTANEESGENITQYFAENVVGATATGAPFDVYFGKASGIDQKGTPGSFYYQASSTIGETNSTSPNTYSATGQNSKKVDVSSAPYESKDGKDKYSFDTN